MFSKSCEYGIKATLYISYQSQLKKRVGIKDIAGAINSPEAFTAKILRELVKVGIIQSTKGPHGGFEIESEKHEKLKLAEIVLVLDGDQIYNGCGLGLKECNALKPCPVHNDFVKVRDELKVMLESTMVKDLANGLINGNTFLKR
ncbi:MAG: Rrf2 family transcriptional regulator [Crocinitomicaceae bacterium]